LFRFGNRNLMWFENISSAKQSFSRIIVGLRRASHPDPAHRNRKLGNAGKPSKNNTIMTLTFWEFARAKFARGCLNLEYHFKIHRLGGGPFV
jgi:hypothetical protein